jgi:hypothetical protein
MNLFSRQNDNDLLKYLDSTEYLLVSNISKIFALETLGEIALDLDNCLYVLEKGKLQFYTFNNRNQKIIVDDCNENEIVWETAFFTRNIAAQKSCLSLCIQLKIEVLSKSVILAYDRKELEQIFSQFPLIHLKIQAAINDSLCEKHIRITQKLVRE